MSTMMDEIREKALSLSEEDRVDLLNALADSIHEDPGLSDAWLQEIRRRREQVASGEVELLDEDEMFARIEARRK
jgi:putative addiction module component (TIGR02574 family)